MSLPTRPLTVTLVHGTFSSRASWTRDGSAFRQSLQTGVGPGVRIRRFEWSGANTHAARLKAGVELATLVAEGSRSSAGHILIGHSHGGNVALYAAGHLEGVAPVAAVVCLSTPFWRIEPRPFLRSSQAAFSQLIGLLGAVSLVALVLGLAVPEGLRQYFVDFFRPSGLAIRHDTLLRASTVGSLALPLGLLLSRKALLEKLQDSVAQRLQYRPLRGTTVLTFRTRLDEALLWLRGIRLGEGFMFCSIAALSVLVLGALELWVVALAPNLPLLLLGLVGCLLCTAAGGYLVLLAGASLGWLATGLPWGIGQGLVAAITVSTRAIFRPPGVLDVRASMLFARTRQPWRLRHAQLCRNRLLAEAIGEALPRLCTVQKTHPDLEPPSPADTGAREESHQPARKSRFVLDFDCGPAEAMQRLSDWLGSRGGYRVEAASADRLLATLDPTPWLLVGPRRRIELEASIEGPGSPCSLRIEAQLTHALRTFLDGWILASFGAGVVLLLLGGSLALSVKTSSPAIYWLPGLLVTVPSFVLTFAGRQSEAVVEALESRLRHRLAWHPWSKPSA